MKNIIIGVLWVSLGLGSFYYNLKIHDPVPRSGIDVVFVSALFVIAAPITTLIALGHILGMHKCAVNCGGK